MQSRLFNEHYIDLTRPVLCFQVLTAAVGICSVEFTVTQISTTVRTTTKPKLLTRFAKRTPWWWLRRSREYERDSPFDFEHWDLIGFKERKEWT